MSNHEMFELQSRRHGDQGFVVMAHIKCSECPTELWKPARDSGIANRVFHQAGWLIGTRRSTDLCPACRQKKRMRRHNHKPLSGPQKRAAYNQIEARKIAILDGVVGKVDTNPFPYRPPPLPMNPAIPPDVGEVLMARLKMPSATDQKGAAKKAFKELSKNWAGPTKYPVHGVDYITFKEGDRWYWLPYDKATPDQIHTWHKGRKHKPYILKGPAHVQHPVPPPVLDRVNRRKISDQLDTIYNSDAERYGGDWSDEKLAIHLDVPRKWVETVRLEMYGDHDRNEAAAQNIAKLDDAIKLAEAAYNRLLEMATEADKVMADLKAARAKLTP